MIVSLISNLILHHYFHMWQELHVKFSSRISEGLVCRIYRRMKCHAINGFVAERESPWGHCSTDKWWIFKGDALFCNLLTFRIALATDSHELQQISETWKTENKAYYLTCLLGKAAFVCRLRLSKALNWDCYFLISLRKWSSHHVKLILMTRMLHVCIKNAQFDQGHEVMYSK